MISGVIVSHGGVNGEGIAVTRCSPTPLSCYQWSGKEMIGWLKLVRKASFRGKEGLVADVDRTV